jgi:putative selenium metabolism hydrolase
VSNDRLKSETVSFSQELVQTPSLSGQEKEVATLVKKKMLELDFDQVSMDKYGNVIGKVIGEKRSGDSKRVLFDGHMDIVSTGELSKWKHDPFAAEIEQGRMYGRGTCDMKSGLSSIIHAVGSMDRGFSGELIISASIGEEVMEGYALSPVIEAVRPDYVILAEPTGLNINRGHRGRAGIVVTSTGKTCHTARPEMGKNAVYGIIPAVQAIRGMKLPCDDDLGDGSIELLDIVSSPFPSLSQVPEKCVTRFDRRVVVGETQEGVLDDMKKCLANITDVEVSYNRGKIDCFTGEKINAPDFRPGWVFSENHEIVTKSKKGLEGVGIKPNIMIGSGCVNGSASGGLFGIPTIVFGPGSKMSHLIDEYIEIKEIEKSVDGFKAIAAALVS